MTIGTCLDLVGTPLSLESEVPDEADCATEVGEPFAGVLRAKM